MEKNLSEAWRRLLAQEFDKPYYKNLDRFIQAEYDRNLIFPPKDEIFSAFSYVLPEQVKVLVIGQDPYHDEQQAHGLAFSVRPGNKIPPSLLNIFKELKTDLGCYIPNNGYLRKWAQQGVLLLNTVLTVRAHEANSHQNKGWEEFTDEVIRILNRQEQPIVIMLLGKPAQRKERMLTNPKHFVLKASHPSPLSVYRGFFGSKCFSRCNDYLISKGIEPIDWQINDIE